MSTGWPTDYHEVHFRRTPHNPCREAVQERVVRQIRMLRALFLTLRTLAYSRVAVQLEVLALRHQLEVLKRTRPRRVRLAKTDRWLWVMLSRFWTRW